MIIQCKHDVMKLPNSLSKVIGKFKGKQSIAELVARTTSTKENSAKHLADLATYTNKMVLAYLWIAIESDYNVLVSAENDADADSFIESLSNFVPPYKTVIETNAGSPVFDKRINFLSLIQPKGASFADNMKFIQKQMPDRLIIRNVEKGNLDTIFSLSKEGISFTASIGNNLIGKQTVKLLQSNLFKVKPSNMQMLDISVILGKENGKYKIISITEYKWLDRGEIRAKEWEFIPKRYENIRILKDGKLNVSDILSSKVVRNYAKQNLISEEAVIDEIRSRSSLLDELITANFDGKKPNLMEMYYEIK